jgi:hypothetical protein
VDGKSRRCGAGRTLNDATIAPSGPKPLRGCPTFIDDGLPNRYQRALLTAQSDAFGKLARVQDWAPTLVASGPEARRALFSTDPSVAIARVLARATAEKLTATIPIRTWATST